jgi:hypothetical protein
MGRASVSSDYGSNWSGKHPSYAPSPPLRIGEQDVQEYLARQHPQKKALGHKSERAFPLNPRHTQVFPAAEKPVTGFRT